MGITPFNRPLTVYGPTLVLGGGEVSLLEMTGLTLFSLPTTASGIRLSEFKSGRGKAETVLEEYRNESRQSSRQEYRL